MGRLPGAMKPKRQTSSTRLVLRPEYSRWTPLFTVVALAGVLFSLARYLRHLEVPQGLLCGSFLVFVGCVYAHLTRVIFEIDGDKLRGYRLKLGLRTRRMEHPLEDIRDIGLRLHDTGDGTATFIVLLRGSGPPVNISTQLLLAFIQSDSDLLALRAWFLEQRYGESRPAEIPDELVVIED